MTSFTLKDKASSPDTGFHTFAIKCYMKRIGGAAMQASKLTIESSEGEFTYKTGAKKC